MREEGEEREGKGEPGAVCVNEPAAANSRILPAGEKRPPSPLIT